jgi:hypothetical protein
MGTNEQMRWVIIALSFACVTAVTFGQDAADADGRITFEPALGSVHAPVLMCRAEVAHGFPFVVDLPLAVSTDKPIEVSNLIQPDIQIALHYFETPRFSGSSGRRLSLREDESIPNDPRSPNVQVEVYRVDNGRRILVSARWQGSGRGLHAIDLARDPLHDLPPAKHTDELDLKLWVPQEEAIRSKNFEEFVTRAEHDQSVPPEARDQLTQSLETFRSIVRNGPADKRRLVLDYWDQGNEPGDYEVICKYHPRRSDPWQQDLVAPPLRIRIIFQASPFDTIFEKLAAQQGTLH